MDQQINRFCRKYKCVYTRYADDISISYHYLKIPHQIAKKSSDLVEIATALEQIINENGFEIQNMKNEITAYGIDNLLFEKEYYITLQRKYSDILKAKIGIMNYDMDVAILIPEENPEIGFHYSESYSKNDGVKLLGFPEYRLGNTIRGEEGKVGGKREGKRLTAFELILAKIHSGNCGGQ